MLTQWYIDTPQCILHVHVKYTVWGELDNHKRSLTHRPSSQGWAFECPIRYVD